jgi:hypothetical protein
MTDKYTIICNYLQECVNGDIYTEDEAQAIADIAYNKYVLESSIPSSLKKMYEKRDFLYKKLKSGELAQTDVVKVKAMIDKVNRDIKKEKDFWGGSTLPGGPSDMHSGSMYKTKKSIGNRFEDNDRAYKAKYK